MLRAVALARCGEGLTRPNPPVGAVLVKNRRLIAGGYHRRAGGPHAEIVALEKAGRRARGADLYVTLEPCSTWGRTPPCVDAIIRARVRRVICGATDPNPIHAGRGFRLLRKAGIEVSTGVANSACKELIEPFAMLQKEGRPFVTLKLGMTIDGRIADARGRSKWITGPFARRMVHALRRRVDGIIVGRETVQRDDPSLMPKPPRGRAPCRIVLDPLGRLPLNRKIFRDEHRARTLVFVGPAAPTRYRTALDARGVEWEELPVVDGRFDLRRVMRALGARGLLHVLCEGGGVLASELVRARLVDEALFFLAPRMLGGAARPAIGGPGWTLARAPRWKCVQSAHVGPDFLMRLRPEDP
jgi:diaminohydroxyphosphoribosylaminopyrimidine deaminase/5-amino-6-(5-phosphoribosylamino)uracil reductase